MPNYLSLIFQPQIKHEVFFRLMSEFRKGGLNPSNIDDFINECNRLPPYPQIRPRDFIAFEKFELEDLSDDDHIAIMREIRKRSKKLSQKCWHPDASKKSCSLDKNGRVKISGAHSIQNNGVLNQIAENGHVKTYDFNNAEFDGIPVGRNLASVFWGFCNTHDRIFSPIETEKYTKTSQQNFLFAYRAFTVTSHSKDENQFFIDYGEQAENDTKRTKEIFDKALIDKNYDIISTDIIELSVFYPLAVSSSFYLDYDFKDKLLTHSETRMEFVYITVLPKDNKTIVLISYLKDDSKLYSELVNQLIERDNLLSDLSVLIAAHCENIFFNPTYYDTFIQKHEDDLEKLLLESQFDIGTLSNDGKIESTESFTPPDYLQNKYNIQLFGYSGIK